MRPTKIRTWAMAAATAAVTCALTVAAPATAHAETSPAGANDWNCEPSAEHPRPVVLVHGTFENMAFNWQWLSPVLKRAGYCVFALNYGTDNPESPIQGTGDIPTSARQLAGFTDKVLAATGADEVDMIGHSQGGMMPRYYVKFLGGADKVEHVIGLAASNHGTDTWGLVDLAKQLGVFQRVGELFPAVAQQAAGSDFLAKLNAGDESPSGVRFTNLVTKYDEIVTPYTSGFVEGGDNVVLQDKCRNAFSEHLAIIWDSIAHRFVLNVLDGTGSGARINCFDPLRGAFEPRPEA